MATIERDLAFSTISDTASRIRTRQISPVEITEALLSRIEKIDPQIQAFVTLTADLALEQAKKAEQDIVLGRYKGPLHGIPIVHKDICYTQGIRTSAGSKLLLDFVPDHDATVVKKLHAAGTVLLGKVHTHEFAIGNTVTRNPWDLERVPGGSSSGTGAGVAAGLTFMGTGTDTGGSIRFPAAYCGIVGIKPTYGRVSRHGIFPLAWSLDHAGPLTRSVKDAALCLQAMAGYDPKDEASADLPVPDYTAGLREDLKGVKIGIPAEYYSNVDEDVKIAMNSAIQTIQLLGAEVIELSLPYTEHAAGAMWAILIGEMASIHEQWYETRADEYGPIARQVIEAGKALPADTYLRAQRSRQIIQRDYLAALSKVDILLTPTTPTAAPHIGDPSAKYGIGAGPSNTTGLPSLVLPCGFSSEGLPISMQLIGKAFDESKLFGVGYAFEHNTAWHNRHPQL